MAELASRVILGALALGTLAAGTVLTAGKAAHADGVADFYKGKQLKMIIRSAPGGGYDTYARLLALHVVNHIPGPPDKMLSINMPGGGGLKAANYVANVAPKDGTVLTIVSRGLPMYQVTDGRKLQGDVRKFGWICDLSDSNPLLVTWHASPAKTIADAKTRTTIIGATGAGSISVQIPSAYNKLLDTKLKIIYGYKGGGDVNLAMERGEVEGRATNNLASWKSTNPEWIEGKKLNFLMQLGLARDPELPDVPLLTDLVKGTTREKEQVARFLTLANVVGRPIAVGPDVPAERVAALRNACGATMKDPAFIKAAGEQRAEIGFRPGAEVQSIIEEIVSAPKPLVERVTAYMKPGSEAEARVSKLRTVSSAIVKVNRKGRELVIKDGGADAEVRVSGRRTKVTLGGKKAKRSAIKSGMTCDVTYEGPGSEASTVACK